MSTDDSRSSIAVHDAIEQDSKHFSRRLAKVMSLSSLVIVASVLSSRCISTRIFLCVQSIKSNLFKASKTSLNDPKSTVYLNGCSLSISSFGSNGSDVEFSDFVVVFCLIKVFTRFLCIK